MNDRPHGLKSCAKPAAATSRISVTDIPYRLLYTPEIRQYSEQTKLTFAGWPSMRPQQFASRLDTHSPQPYVAVPERQVQYRL